MLSRKPLFGVRGALSLCIVAIVGWGVSVASAAPVPLPANASLQDLINLNASGGIQIGNFIFSDFSFTPTSGSPTNPAPTAVQITVSTAPGPGTGLTFNSFWQSNAGANQDGIIRYAVQVTPGLVINQVNLAFNGAAPVPSPGTSASVTETVSTLVLTNNVPSGPGTAIGQLTVANSIATGTTTTNNSTLNVIPPQTGIFVSKDVQVVSVGANGIATISWVDNTYTAIPEPATIGLFGAMGVVLLARRRRV
jgi:hypothetical protein